MKRRNVLILILSGGIILGQTLKAQNKDTEISDLTNKIFNAREINTNLVPKYTWTSRTEILKSKEILNILIEKNHYDQQNHLLQKVLNEQSARMPTVFLIKEIAETEKENMEKFLYGLRDFLKKYSLEDINLVKKFISTASWKVADSTHEFVFTGKNVEVSGDQMIWMVEDINYSTSRIEVNTVFEGAVIHFAASFIRLKDGLNYLAYAEAHIPSKNITLQIQNYVYIID
jgi:hypothetical protein